METNFNLTEPIKAYNLFLKDSYHNNAVQFFDKLTEQSKIDIEANRNTVAQIKTKNTKIKKVENSLGKNRFLKGLTIFLIISLFIAAIISAYYAFKDSFYGLFIITIIGVFGGAALIFAIKPLNKKIKEIQGVLDILARQKKELIKEAYGQMQALNDAYDWGMPSKILTETTPLIKMDQYFDQNKFYYLKNKYGFKENDENNISTVFVQSGSIVGNPFIVERNYVSQMVDHVYRGELVITWTTVVGSGKDRRVVTHSQTLVATVTKPAAEHFYETWLVYGNEAAPNLSFSRAPSKANSMNEKQIKKFAADFERDLERKIQSSSYGKRHLTKMSNSEFEALFNATNRDNDVEFRLLFTPLAQKNMLELMKSKKPYGDDFYFTKTRELNYIKSKHSQDADLDADPNKFVHYDYDFARSYFINYCDNYFTSFYFDLAPLLSIPLYQHHIPFEEIFKGTLDSNLTSFETEVMANRFDQSNFKHELSDTPAILKSNFVRKNGVSDIVNIHAYSYQKIPHVSYIPKLGGDGRMHDVPVKWFEFIPLEQVTPFAAQECRTTQRKFLSNIKNQGLENLLSRISNKNMLVYSKGLVSLLLKETSLDFDANELNKYLLEDSNQEENYGK
ncbi:MAG TPA: hypothetical protein GX010_01825 [Erysipelotrichaceae bacterium]|nr:hypothetical protein [Erysipelotrichaceae bacterium]